jgi:acyl-CoA synthetase (AMP-forming)/AMP-acid ligase II
MEISRCPELVETLFACARLGAIFVPLNARMPAAELQVFVDQSTPRTFVAEEGLLATARASAPERAREFVAFPAGAGIGDPGAAGPAPVRADPGADPSAPVLIAFTSGTTGSPRGAVMTHEALTANALDMVLALQMSPGDEILTFTIHETPGKSLTAGKPAMRCQLRVADAAGHDVAPGTRGEIVVRGPGVMRGYWQNPEATRLAIRDGWFHPGDLGFIDEEGFLHVADRIKEIIVVGVSNVSPADLEAVLAESPDIEAAAVVGRPDHELGEVPVAFVVPAPGRVLSREQVLSPFEGRLAKYKHPRDVIFLEALPRTSVGKPEKKALRAIAHSNADPLPAPRSMSQSGQPAPPAPGTEAWLSGARRGTGATPLEPWVAALAGEAAGVAAARAGCGSPPSAVASS